MADAARTIRSLIGVSHDLAVEGFVELLGPLALVGAASPVPDGEPQFRYATEHKRRDAGAPHPLAALLDSVAYGLVKRARSAFATTLVVGRAPNCDVWIDDVQISKLHARIVVDPARGHLLNDGGSANGTFVDEERIGDRSDRVLVEGTRVRFGERAFVARDVALLHATLRRFPRP
jgi:hypothetical protein